ncbi:CHAT domain-containing protein [Deminuibacter soli]|uniref:CHAT domain-containing protein n=1 Tax=Deminuibacter soli TaxID=2291815 RepID=A0A3E1NH29_9BACT|nr:CHAT domain-containing protein [Deminuibacter soli]RFM27260.1 CHAT domain-containing protein [Deminuibacter soli]
MKVILLAFANSYQNPLPNLTAEANELNDILSERYIAGDYIVHLEAFATPERTAGLLRRYERDLIIFHFSGHAGSNQLQMNEQFLYAPGMAAQLKVCAENELKLVVLNGCATYAQTKLLLDAGVPAVIATSAPVEDVSARNFSVSFWEQLVKNDETIEDACKEALRAAAPLTQQVLPGEQGFRHLVTDYSEPAHNPDAPLWRLDALNDDAVSINPIPVKPAYAIYPKPNNELIKTLFESFQAAGNPRIIDYFEREQNNIPVQDNDKQIAIVNSIPFPIGIHLQKLICPITETEGSGYDVMGFKRLKQIAQLFQTTTEFLGIIMIAQIWELYIKFDQDFVLSDELKTALRTYLNPDKIDRETYNYIPLIQTIREYLRNVDLPNARIRQFIDEQDILKDLFEFDQDFKNACDYLYHLRVRTAKKVVNEDRMAAFCNEAERQLCVFVKPLGFIHRYHLTSVQQIDILKLRHINRDKAEYVHRIVRCMQAIGKDEWNYYYINSFLDNWGVILLKCDVTTIDAARKKYKVTVKDYLNLTPFVIDRNSFIERTDLPYIMFYKGEVNEDIYFKRVKDPTNAKESFVIPNIESEEDRFNSIRMQFVAFKKFIA